MTCINTSKPEEKPESEDKLEPASHSEALTQKEIKNLREESTRTLAYFRMLIRKEQAKSQPASNDNPEIKIL